MTLPLENHWYLISLGAVSLMVVYLFCKLLFKLCFKRKKKLPVLTITEVRRLSCEVQDREGYFATYQGKVFDGERWEEKIILFITNSVCKNCKPHENDQNTN